MILNDPSSWRSTPDYREITPETVKAGAYKAAPDWVWPIVVVVGFGIQPFIIWLILFAINHS